MTCHVAWTTDDAAVMLSDSQASTPESEVHGVQKQYVGSDFLIGGTGSILVIRELFRFLDKIPDLASKHLGGHLHAFFKSHLTTAARGQASFIVVAEADGRQCTRRWLPGLFSEPLSPSSFAALGSGEEFVLRALQRDDLWGLHRPAATVPDLFVQACDYLKAADESLTVDDRLQVGIIYQHRTYAMGDKSISLPHLPKPIRNGWAFCGKTYEECHAIAEAINGTTRQAARAMSSVRHGFLPLQSLIAIRQSAMAVHDLRWALAVLLKEFMQWYDGALGRESAATT